MERVAVDFWRWPRRELGADIRSDLGQASNAGQRQNQRNPGGREAEGQLAPKAYVFSVGRRIVGRLCQPPPMIGVSQKRPTKIYQR